MNLDSSFHQSQLQQYFDSLKVKQTSGATINRKISSLNSFRNFLIKKGYIKSTPTPSLDTSTPVPNLIKNKNFLKNTFLSRYLIFGTLIALILGLGYGLYTQAILKAKQELAYSTASAPVRAGRILSFQGRLTDTSGNPITSSTSIVFKFFNLDTGGTQLYTSEIGNSQTIIPDENGIFSVVIGKTHGTEIPSDVFTENPEVWLEITADSETMDPRQHIATVAYAVNSETLQGLPPSASGLKDTVLVIDSEGNLNLGETSPTIKSTSGTLAVEGQALLLKASDGSGGNITINPDGNGTIRFLTEGTSPNVGGFVDFSNANIASGNLINSQINNDNFGYNFISLQNYNPGTTELSSRFSVGASGNVYISNNLNAGGTITFTGLPTGTGSTIVYINSSGNLVSGTLPAGTVYTASNGITMVANDFQINPNYTNNWLVAQNFASDIGLSGNLTIGGSFVSVGSTNLVTNLNANYLNGFTSSSFLQVGGTGFFSQAVNGLQAIGVTGIGLGGTLTQLTNIDLNSNDLNFYGLGKIGIGTTSPSAKLTITGLEGGTDDLFLVTGNLGNPKFAIQEDGGIGIGIPDPQYRLHVSNRSFDQAYYFASPTYTDRTTEAKTSYGTAYAIVAATNTVFYIADEKMFEEIYFDIATASTAGRTLTYEYSQGGGSWQTLSVNDGTNALRVDGSLTFTAPSDWAQDTVNGAGPYYWFRITTTNDPGTDPTAYLTVPSSMSAMAVFAQEGDSPSIEITRDGAVYFRGHAADTAALPAFTWLGDTNTGMFRVGTDILGLSTGGIERFRLASNGALLTGNLDVTGYVGAGYFNTGALSVGEQTGIAAALVVNGGKSAFTIPSGQVVFLDSFTTPSNTYLTSHTPDIGTGWSMLIQNGTPTMRAQSIGYADVTATVADSGVLYTAETASPIPSADYEVKVTAVTIDTADDVAIIAARIQDSNNMYLYKFSGTAANNVLYKRVGGTWTVLGTSTLGIAAGNIVKLRVVGSNITVYRDQQLLISATDSDITDAGKAGIGAGEIPTTTDDADTTWNLDDFTITTYSDVIPDALFLGGNVGIGTTSPSKKLDIVGDINLTGTIFSSGTSGSPGQILSSTGTGLSWINANSSSVGTTYAAGVGLTLSDTNFFSLDLASTNTWTGLQTFQNNFAVGSSALISNLNAQYLNGIPSTGFLQVGGTGFLNDLTAGVGISITGTGVGRTITNTGLLSLNTLTGNLTLAGGTDVSVIAVGNTLQVHDTSTLQTVTNRGASTTNQISINYAGAPFVLSSGNTTTVTNLSADLLDGRDSTYFVNTTQTAPFIYTASNGITLVGQDFRLNLGYTNAWLAPQFFTSGIGVTGLASFTNNIVVGGTFVSVGSTNLVTNLNAQYLGGIPSTGFLQVGYTGFLSNLTAGSGISITGVGVGRTITNTGVLSATGTANQIYVNGGLGPATGAVTFTLPQGIGLTSPVQFDRLYLANAGIGLSTAGAVRVGTSLTVGSIPSISDNNVVLTSNGGVVSSINTTNWDKDSGDDYSVWMLAASLGTPQSINSGNTASFLGGTGIGTSISGNDQLTITNTGLLSLNTLTGNLTLANGTGTTIGTAGNTLSVNLTNTGVSSGSYGSGTSIPTFTVDAQGRLTLAGQVALPSGTVYTASNGITEVSNDFRLDLTYSPTWSGIHTFNAIPAFNGGTSASSAPFTVDSTYLVSNLNAQYLNGHLDTDFLQVGGTGFFSRALNGLQAIGNTGVGLGGTLTQASFTNINIGAGSSGLAILGLNNNTQALVIRQNGNVGIGTTNPLSNLHISQVASPANPDIGAIMTIEGSDIAYYNAISTTDRWSGLTMGDKEDVDEANVIYDASTKIMYFGTNGTYNQMTLNSTGNLSVGTTTYTGSLNINKPTSVGGSYVAAYVGTGTTGFLGYLDTSAWDKSSADDVWALAASLGTAQAIGSGNTASFLGGTGIGTSISGNDQLTITNTGLLSLNSLTGNLTLANGTGTTISTVGNTLSVNLTNTGVALGSYGSGTSIPTFTVDAQGRLTAAGQVAAPVDTNTLYTAGVGLTLNTIGNIFSAQVGLGITINASNQIAPIYGSAANQIAQGNTALYVRPTGNLTLSAGSTAGTSGGGFNATFNTVMNPNFTTSVFSPIFSNNGSAVTFGSAGALTTILGSGLTITPSTSITGNLTLGGTFVSVGSTNLVTNLNADLLDGYHATSFLQVGYTGFLSNLTGGSGISITGVGVGRTITNTGLLSLNTLTGNLTLANGTGTTLSTVGNTLSVNLTNTGVSAATYGSGTSIPIITVDAQGRITSASSVLANFESPLTFNNGLTRSGNTVGLGGTLSSDTKINLSSFDLSFLGLGNSQSLFLSSNGMVGIGTTSPTSKLELAGSGSLFRIADALNNTLVDITDVNAQFNLPTTFTSTGDVSMANNLIFTNPLASYINSVAPLYLQAGESFNSSNLTLRTYNAGQVVVDSSALNVGGTFILSQGASDGYILQTDTSGNSSWVDPATLGLGITYSAGVGLTLSNTNIFSLDLASTNTWTGVQTFQNNFNVGSSALISNLNAQYLGGIGASGFLQVGYTGFLSNLTGGSGISITGVGVGRTITNTGLLSLNSLTGNLTLANGTGTTISTVGNTLSVNLTNTGVALGSYGSGTSIPTFTVDAQGRLTAAGQVAAPVDTNTLYTAGVGLTLNTIGNIFSAQVGLGITINASNQIAPIYGSAANQIAQGNTALYVRPTGNLTLSAGSTAGTSGGGFNATFNTVMNPNFTTSVFSPIFSNNGSAVTFGSAGALTTILGSGLTITPSTSITGNLTLGGTFVSVGSTNLVTNLNADLLDGYHATSFLQVGYTGFLSNLTGGSGISITGVGVGRTITNTGLLSLNSLTGNLTLANGTGTTISTVGNTLSVNLTNTGVALGSYGSGTSIPTFTVDAQGRLTAAGQVAAPVDTNTLYTAGVGLTLNTIGNIFSAQVGLGITINASNQIAPIYGSAANQIAQGNTALYVRPTGNLTLSAGSTAGTSGGGFNATFNTVMNPNFTTSVFSPIFSNNGSAVTFGSAGALTTILGSGLTITPSTSITGNLTLGGTFVSVGSTNLVTNLNADLLDGYHATSFLQVGYTGFLSNLTGGSGISITGVGVGRTITNTGLLSLNSLTGNLTLANGTGTTISTVGNTLSVNLTNTGVALGSYGSGTSIPTFTVDAQGRLTAAGQVAAPVDTNTLYTAGVGLTLNTIGNIFSAQVGLGITINASNQIAPIYGSAANQIAQGNTALYVRPTGNLTLSAGSTAGTSGGGFNATFNTVMNPNFTTSVFSPIFSNNGSAVTFGSAGALTTILGSGLTITPSTSITGNLTLGGTFVSVGSTNLVTNLNADLLDGYHATSFLQVGYTGFLSNLTGGSGISITGVGVGRTITNTGLLSLNSLTGNLTLANGTGTTISTVGNTLSVNLTNTGVALGSYGSGTSIPTFTVDAQGRLTAAGQVAAPVDTNTLYTAGVGLTLNTIGNIFSAQVGLGITINASNQIAPIYGSAANQIAQGNTALYVRPTGNLTLSAGSTAGTSGGGFNATFNTVMNPNFTTSVFSPIFSNNGSAVTFGSAGALTTILGSGLTITPSTSITGNLTLGGTFVSVGSTNLVSNLNADYLDGHDSSYFLSLGDTGTFIQSLTSGVGISISGIGVGRTITNTGVLSAQGTANQILVNSTTGVATTGALTLTLPQDIGMSSNVTFGNLTLGGTFVSVGSTNLVSNLNADYLDGHDSSYFLSLGDTGTFIQSLTSGVGISISGIGVGRTITNTGVLSAQGTANQILVNSTTGVATTGALTLTLPQDIGMSSNVTFGNLTLGGTFVSVGSTNLVSNLNADYLDGHDSTYFLDFGDTGPFIQSLTSGVGISISGTGIGRTISNTGVLSAAGTANQILVNGGTAAATGAITLTLPQGIGTTSDVQFDQLYLANTGIGLSTAGSVSIGSSLTVATNLSAGGTVTFTGLPVGTGSTIVYINSSGVLVQGTLPASSSYTAGNGITLSGSIFKLGGTLTENTTIGTSSFSLSFLGLGGTQSLFIGATGNVGIGTTNPTAKLHIVGDAYVSTTLTVGNTITATNIPANQIVRTNATSQLIGTSGTANQLLHGNLSWGDVLLGTQTSGNYVSTVIGNSQIAVTGAAGEGVGVSLSIVGDSIGDSQLAYNTGQHLTTTSGVQFDQLYLANTGIGLSTAGSVSIGSSLTVATNLSAGGTVTFTGLPVGTGSTIVYINSSGVLVQGTLPASSSYTAGNGITLSGSIFKLGGTLTENTTIGTSSFSLSFLGLGGTQSLFIGATGNVGIGTTNPTAKLHIVGDAYVSTTLTVGNTITATNIPANQIVRTNATSQLIGTSGTANQLLHGNLSWGDVLLGTQTSGNYVSTVIGNSQIAVTGAAGEGVGVSLSIVGDSIGDSQLAYNTGQHLTTTSGVQFDQLYLANTGIGLSTAGSVSIGSSLAVAGQIYAPSLTVGATIYTGSLNINKPTSVGGSYVAAYVGTGSTGFIGYLDTTGWDKNSSDDYSAWILAASLGTAQTISTGNTAAFFGWNGIGTSISGTNQLSIGLGGTLTQNVALTVGNTAAFFINSTSGFVGIGTSDPSSLLTVNGTISSHLYQDIDNSDTFLNLNNTSNNSSSLSFTETGSIKWNAKYNYNTGWKTIIDGFSPSKIENFATGLLLSVGVTDASDNITSWNSNLFLAATGNVGIGTTSPTKDLDVLGDSVFNNIYIGTTRTYGGYGAIQESGDGIKSRIIFGSNSNDRAEIYTEITSTSNTGLVLAIKDDPTDYIDFYNGTSSIMRLMQSGKVGIGTPGPEAQLTVRGSSANETIGNNTTSALRIVNSAGASLGELAELQFAHNPNQNPGAAISSAYSSWVSGALTYGADLIFSTTPGSTLAVLPQERMRIKYNGNVGIGTTNPQSKLDVVFDTSAGTRRFRTNDTAAGVFLQRSGDTSGWGMAYGFLSNDASIDWGGFGAYGSGNSTFYRYYIGRDLTDATMTITDGTLANGRVGIGTASPNEKLEVNGNIITTVGNSLPHIVLDSGNAGDNWTSQGAYISLGEGGSLANTSLNLTYVGDGYSYVGSGTVTRGVPGQSYIRFAWNNDIIYASDNLIVANKFGIGATHATAKFNVSGNGNISTSLSVGTSLVINGTTGTAINITGTGIATDINLQNSETIDNNINGLIKLTGSGSATNSFFVGGNYTGPNWNMDGNGGIGATGYGKYMRGYIAQNLWNDGTNFRVGHNAGAGLDDFSGIASGNDGQLYFISGSVATTSPNFSIGNNLDSYIGMSLWKGKVGIGVFLPSQKIMLDANTYGTNTGWVDASDRNLKENYTNLSAVSMTPIQQSTWTGNNSTIESVDYASGSNVNLNDLELLNRLSLLPIHQYNFIKEDEVNLINPDSKIKRIGPTAQDFYKSFGLGGNDTSIRATDMAGVALAGVKALITRLDDIYISDTGQVAINYNVSDEVLSSLGYSGTKNEIEAATYSLTDSAGQLVTRVGQYGKLAAAKIETAYLSAKSIVVDNLAAKKIASETIITGDITGTEALFDSATIGTLTAESIGASEASFSTVYADQIINPEGNISEVFATKISDLRDEIKSMIASSSAVATPSAIALESETWDTSIATESADLVLDNLTLSDSLVIGAQLTVGGHTSLNTANVTGTLTVGQIAIKDNLIETTAEALYIQPSGLGSVHILNDRLVLSSDGSVTVNGNLNVTGSLIAEMLKAEEIETKKLTTEKINISTSVIASDSAAISPIIAANALPAEVSTQSGTLASNATVGTVTLAAGQTEITIQNPSLTANSMVYLTPGGSTGNQVVYIKSKSVTDPLVSPTPSAFTIAIDQPLTQNVDINWWLIN